MPPSSAAAYSALKDAEAKRLSPDAAVAQGESKYGVAGISSQLDSLRGITRNLETSIKNVDPSVTGRTNGSLVTEAARQRIVSNERAPLVDQYDNTAKSLADTSGQYDRATGLASNYANNLLANDKANYDRLFGEYTTLSQQEAEAAKAAEAKREFDLSLAEQKASRAGSGIAGLGGFGGGDTPAAPATPVTPQYAKNTTPQAAVADAFAGYKPGVKPGYTEQVVLPAIERLLAMNHPNYKPGVIQEAARSLVYSYRKANFGE